MTIERKPSGWLTGAALALAGWWSLLLVWPLLDGRARTVTVMALSEGHLLRAIAGSDVALLEGSGRVMVLAGRSPGFVRQLYAAGGILVLATDGRGCIGTRNSGSAR
ncbi:MAG: hypothetical protein O9342_01835 [Beijerinckiaceae bacterium]|nr:hypothetical protein [Beijerinckiaceae bacterium]